MLPNTTNRQHIPNNTNIPMLYQNIVSSGPFKFTTVSPPYDPDYKDVYDTFMSIVCRNRKIFDKILLVCEMTENLRLHFHMMYNLKPDMIKRHYFFINKSLRGAQQWNVLVTSKPPKEGCSYLQKDTEIKEFISEYVFDHNSIETYLQCKKNEKKLMMKCHTFDPYSNRPTPEWFLNLAKYDTSDSE